MADVAMMFSREEDARRVMAVLPKRFEKYGLTMHPDKSRLVEFRRPDRRPPDEGGGRPGSFDLLGFTHFWAKSRKGNWVVKQKTAKDRLSRALARINKWYQRCRHYPIQEQCEMLRKKLKGHLDYYGITGNSIASARTGWRLGRAVKAELRSNRLGLLARLLYQFARARSISTMAA